MGNNNATDFYHLTMCIEGNEVGQITLLIRKIVQNQ